MPIFTDRLSINAKVITVTTVLTEEDCVIVCDNLAVNITTTLPPIINLVDGHVVAIGRGGNSTGTITITLGAGATGVQGLLGTIGATTSIGLHGATGQGLIQQFIKIGTIWYRKN